MSWRESEERNGQMPLPPFQLDTDTCHDGQMRQGSVGHWDSVFSKNTRTDSNSLDIKTMV